MLRLERSRADKEPQLASRALCSHVDHRLVMSLRDATLGPSSLGFGTAAGQLKRGSSQAAEALITEAEQGQPCGNCVQLTDGTGGGGATINEVPHGTIPKVVYFPFHLQKRQSTKPAPHVLFNMSKEAQNLEFNITFHLQASPSQHPGPEFLRYVR